VAGDFDHDGFPDLAGPGGNEPAAMFYFFGDGRGNFSMQTVVGPYGSIAAAGDFNGDGLPDVVIADRFSFVSLSLGRKDRNFLEPLVITAATSGVSVGDINGDGLPDIFTGGNPLTEPPTPGTVLLNQGGTSFSVGGYTDPYSEWLSDLTGKGVVDLLGGNQNLEIWPNNGTPDFSSSPITFSQPTPGVWVADMDGDGHPDIVTSTGQIYYGNGAYQFSPPVSVGNLSGPYVIGDFNGDGKLDIASGSSTFLNTGNRTFQEVAGSNLPLVGNLAVGDFNGDGKDDVAFSGPGDSFIEIYYSNGDGTFYLGTILNPGEEPVLMVTGDFNGDGKVDLAVGLINAQQVCILFNAGGGQFSRSFFASGALAVSMNAADLNRDGKPEILIGNFEFDFAPPNINVVFHQ
jgi:hypothetical protein